MAISVKSYFLRSYKKISAVAIAAFLIGGCTTPVTPDFSGMSANYANILEQYQLNSILMNIIRASKERPLSFLDIPSINGSGNVTTTPSISGSMNGFIGGLAGGAAGISSISPSLNLTFGNSFNFSQSSLDNATFLRGFLSPIPVSTAKFFISENIPREVMFSLLIESIEINHPGEQGKKFVNNPLLPEYPDFQKQLYQLIDYGLTVEQVEIQHAQYGAAPFSGPKALKGPQVSPIEPFPSYSGLGGASVGGGFGGMATYGGLGGFGGLGGYGGGQFDQMQNQYRYKVCVDKNKFANFVKQEFNPGIFCKAPPSAVPVNSKKSDLVLNVRSTNAVFEYLGNVVAAQNKSVPYMVVLPPSSGTPARKQGQANQYALLVVSENSSQDGKQFASVKNLDGDVYSIPGDGNGYSPMVIKIISSLLSLNKIPGSIPSSPGILLR